MEHLFEQLAHKIASSRRILLVAHKKPDGDTLGSSSAFLNWLLREGKDVTAFCADKPPARYAYIDGIERYTDDGAAFDQAYDLVIVFDSSELRYAGVADLVPRLKGKPPLANFDHHFTNANYGDLNIVLAEASSTAEVAYRFFIANRIKIDERMATSLLTGLLEDTGFFSNAATTPMSLQAAGQMLAEGARSSDIQRSLVLDRKIESLRLWGKMLSRLRYNPQYDIATTYALLSDLPEGKSGDLEGMSNFLNAVTAQAGVILVLNELPSDEVKGSFRSASKDVSKLAKLLGGGGHKKAAGFTIKGRIEETPEGLRIST